MEKNRINYLDYAKVFAIICVISIHVGFYQINKVLLFAMPLFFMITGHTFTFGKRSLKESITLRFKTIMLPFVIYMFVYALVEVLRANIFGYGNYKVLLVSLMNFIYGSGIIPFSGRFTGYLRSIMDYKMQPSTGVDLILPSNCHLWFLPATFTGFVLFATILHFANNKNWVKFIFLIPLLFVSCLEVLFPSLNQLPFAIGRGAIGACFMLVGNILKESSFFEKTSKISKLLIFVLCLSIYLVALYYGSDGSSMVRSYYGPYGLLSVLLTFIGGISGAILLLQVCRFIEKLPFTRIKNMLSFMGKNVITFYVLHMLVKFLLDVFYVFVINSGDKILLDEYKMGLLPQNSLIFMIFEVMVIIVVCLIVAKLKNYLKNFKK